MNNKSDNAPQAVLYRMVSDEHICPFGLKTRDLLQRHGYRIEDHPLRSREETEQFKQKHGVDTTPQVFIDGQRIGGYETLRRQLGYKPASDDQTSYEPVIAVFGVSFLMALAASWASVGSVLHVRALELFVAFSMCALAVQKLRDLEAFSFQFITYDLLAMRVVPYSYVYPLAEALAGIGMIAGVWLPVVAAMALFIGSIGAVSVIKAVYIDQRELKCACVGGNSNVPLGAISLTENLMMVAMGLWMLSKSML